MLCSECHFDNETGSLTGHRLPDLPAEFGVAFSPNLTQDTETEVKAIYNKYGCVTCHTETGIGAGDVTKAKINFPADSLLQAWIRNPASFKPLTKMPSFQGIIKDEEYAPIMAYVRELTK